MRSSLWAAAGVCAALIGFGASGTWSAPGETRVEARDDLFRAALVRIAPGGMVAWHSDGRNPHTITADDGSWDSGTLGPGGTFGRTFDRPGRYAYYCRFHGAPGGHGMAGVVIVGEAAAAGAEPRAPSPRPTGPGRTIRVPEDEPTIQAAAAAARPGDLVLVAPGVYREEVVVTTAHVTIRGLDRNRVILDGEFRRHNGVKVLGADGVVIENMTARHHLLNGFYWTGVRGYRGSYLTAYNNGDYGLYAFDSTDGQFDHDYASGHPDSGFYIGQCRPCRALITDVLAERNALGYSGTNAGGDLVITRSVWRRNMSGIVPNTLDSEALAPQGGTRIVGNAVYANHNADAPAKRLQRPTFGNGIVVTGGTGNVVEGNRVWDHPNYGILLVANVDARVWLTSGNRVARNAVWGSGRADLALAFPAAGGDCFAGNRYRRTRPGAAEWLYGCGSALARVGGGDPAVTVVMLRQFVQALAGRYRSGDWRTQPAPPPQPGMPDPLAPPQPAWPTPESRHLPRPVAAAPGAPADAGTKGAWALGLEAAWFGVPWAVYAAWVVVPLWDIGRRRDLRTARKAGWAAGVVLVPLLGPLAYFALARPALSPAARFVLTVGGAALSAAALVI